MTAGEKYAKVLTLRKKKTYKAEDECGFGRNTIANAIKKDRELSEEYHKKFIDHFGVNPEWWETENGEVFLKNGTHEQNEPAVAGKVSTLKVLQDALAEGSDYRLIPRTILDGEYRIELKSALDEKTELRRDAIEGYKKLVKKLEEEIADLRSGKIPITITTPQHTK